MSEQPATYQKTLALAMNLSPLAKKPRHSLRGVLSDLNLDVSREDIDEARREMMKNFPREDIA